MNKYKKGRRLMMIGLTKELEAGRFVYFNNSITQGLIRGMTFNTLSRMARRGMFFKAIETNPKQRG